MHLSQGFVKVLIVLQNNKEITGGLFNQYATLLEPMLNEAGLKRKQLTKSRFKIILINMEPFHLYLKRHFKIIDLEGYLEVLKDPSASRAEMLTASLDDKSKTIHPFDGIYIASYENIDVWIDEAPIKLNCPNGTLTFVSQASKLEIAKNILVVGVENTENILFIAKQKKYFSKYKQKKMFIFRNNFMLHWLEERENDYLHYGDFDFAGISIYQSQIIPRMKGKHTFFIPENIEELLQQGQSDLYYKQYGYKENIMGIDAPLDSLITLIDNYKKTLRQEFLILN